MAPKKKPKTVKKHATVDATVEENDGPEEPQKQKGKMSKVKAPRKKATTQDGQKNILTAPLVALASPVAATPNNEKAVEAEVDKFVGQIAGLGVEGVRSMYNELRTYIPANYRFEEFKKNPRCNRYADVVCLDDTRVHLTVENPGEGDYIHANWVKLDGHDRVYIATQGPLEETIDSFWRMCWEHEVFCVVNLCRTVEDGKNKCAQYWPEKAGEYKTYGKIFVNNKKVEPEDKFTLTTIEILPEGCSNSKIMRLIQFPSWPDGGVPLSGKTVLRLLRLITQQDKLATGNVVMHCSAGIGRTGTIIFIDWVIQRLFRGQPVDLSSLFKELRNQRASCIQSEGQFLFIFSTILDYIQAKMPNRYKEQCTKFNAEVKALALNQA